MKQDCTLQLRCLEPRAVDGAHEDSGCTVAEQPQARLATQPGEAVCAGVSSDIGCSDPIVDGRDATQSRHPIPGNGDHEAGIAAAVFSGFVYRCERLRNLP
jgi:hypothetical protein